jgi:hypothetical protein
MGKTLYPAFYKDSKGEAVFHNSRACKDCTCRCTAESRGLRYRLAAVKSDFKTEHDDKNLVLKQVHVKPNKEI